MNFFLKTAAVFSLVGLSACNTTVAGGSGGVGMSASTSSPTRTGAHVFLASNDMVVYGDPAVAGRFEVQQRASRGGSDYWCAAGQYAVQSLGVEPNARIYLAAPIGDGHLSNKAKTAAFTVSPDVELQNIAAAQSNGLTMTITRVGENWSVAHSRLQCDSDFNSRFR
ncbi:hypothetical protein [Falsihalocynthiibacter arcticus]|uniref:Lipoprotein n=1 Tax=Falsihalocynthiibacter arcticus TaxID=1579316 RepID=A0A126UZZ2_9RHOB|nr:hypothetical protein [Falsihalocynthiibacter arcticus]AML51648.1 hypothetical protein RC74_10575 [Falsihalocynthiibacter arcticus]